MRRVARASKSWWLTLASERWASSWVSRCRGWRNIADWHRLLEMCALSDTLIVDRTGFTTRAILMTAFARAEGHDVGSRTARLRLRLDAGRLSKAKRGELVHHLPTGLVRLDDGTVAFDPDACVQDRIRLVLRKFMETGMLEVLYYLVHNQLKLPRHQVSGLYAGQTLWKEPSFLGAIENSDSEESCSPAAPATASFATHAAGSWLAVNGQDSRRPRTEWLALVKDVYPAYITWEEHERIQEKLEENDQGMEQRLARKRAVRKGAALLSGMIRCMKCGHAMQVTYKDNRFQYKCDGVRGQIRKTVLPVPVRPPDRRRCRR